MALSMASYVCALGSAADNAAITRPGGAARIAMGLESSSRLEGWELSDRFGSERLLAYSLTCVPLQPNEALLRSAMLYGGSLSPAEVCRLQVLVQDNPCQWGGACS